MTLDDPDLQTSEQHYFARYSQLVQHRIIEGHSQLLPTKELRCSNSGQKQQEN
jgi:hypothetical protein